MLGVRRQDVQTIGMRPARVNLDAIPVDDRAFESIKGGDRNVVMQLLFQTDREQFGLSSITRSQAAQGAFENQLILKLLGEMGMPPFTSVLLLTNEPLCATLLLSIPKDPP